MVQVEEVRPAPRMLLHRSVPVTRPSPQSSPSWKYTTGLSERLATQPRGSLPLIVIEHHADVILAADWVMELGPEGGEKGGKLVYAGLPEGLLKQKGSPTGRALEQRS